MWQTIKRIFAPDAAQNAGVTEPDYSLMSLGELVSLNQDLGRAIDEIRERRARINAAIKEKL